MSPVVQARPSLHAWPSSSSQAIPSQGQTRHQVPDFGARRVADLGDEEKLGVGPVASQDAELLDEDPQPSPEHGEGDERVRRDRLRRRLMKAPCVGNEFDSYSGQWAGQDSPSEKHDRRSGTTPEESRLRALPRTLTSRRTLRHGPQRRPRRQAAAPRGRGDTASASGCADIVKRTLLGGLGAVFATEEGIREFVQEAHLPKEVAAYLMDQAQATKKSSTASESIRKWLERVTLGRVLLRLLTSVTFGISDSGPPGPQRGRPGEARDQAAREGAPAARAGRRGAATRARSRSPSP